MKFKNLSTTDTKVSLACLGTMSFGAHVDEKTSHAVMSASLDQGINFFDTAELYAVPPMAETHGKTEAFIGNWMTKNKTRDQIVLASKVVGDGRGLEWIRDGEHALNEKNIRNALEGSLQRLQTDHIDLYQIHWPDRSIAKFGGRYYNAFAPEDTVPLEQTLRALQKLQQEGKIKHVGISNESPWGTMEYLRLARDKDLPRMISIQNNYSLLTRTFDTGMSEISLQEDIGLLAYSPLGFGVLGGRYLNGNKPAEGRFVTYPDYMTRYRTPEVDAQTRRYQALAHDHGMTLPELSLAFVYSRPYLTSNIIGPSNVAQLTECVNAMNFEMTDEILTEIDKIDADLPNPCA